MKIEVLVCRCDGTQAVEMREVTEDWLDPKIPPTSETEVPENSTGA